MKKILFAALFVLVFPLITFASITFDAASSWTTGSSVSSITFTQVIGASSNEMLFVCALSTNNDLSATYDSVSMTKEQTQYDSGDNRYLSLFALPAPMSGSHSVVVSGTGSEAILQAGASSYSGVNQSTTLDAVTSSSTSQDESSYSTTILTVANNTWATLCVRVISGGNGLAAGTNTTFRSTSSNTAIGDNNTAITPAGSYTMTVTDANGDAGFYSIMASFAPQVAANTNAPTFTLQGGSLTVKGSSLTIR